MAEEYWKWTESRWTNPDISWQEGGIITAGVDVGSVSSQAVILMMGWNPLCLRQHQDRIQQSGERQQRHDLGPGRHR